MKKHSVILLILLFVSGPAARSFSENGTVPASKAMENMKYDRQALENKKNQFIMQEGDLPVSEIRIRGLKRTSPEVIRNLAGIRTGEPISLFRPHRLINRLKRKNIFSSIEIDYLARDGKAVIDIGLKEKWTLIVIPMFSGNERGNTYGAYLMESNLFGMAKNLFAGGTYSSTGKSAIMGYIDPSVAGSRFRANIFLIYKDEELEKGDTEENIYSRYKSEQKLVSTAAGYAFTGGMSLYMKFGYRSEDVDRGFDESLNIPGSEKNFSTGAILRFSRISYYEYLYYGYRIEAQALRHTAASDESSSYTVSGMKGNLAFRSFSSNRLTLRWEGFFGSRPAAMEERLSGRDGFRTLPADIITADSYMNGSVIYEVPVYRFSWGALTALGMWEQGRFKRNGMSWEDYYGPGAGFLVYLKRLAVPAMGLNLARNMVTDSNEVSFMIGFSF